MKTKLFYIIGFLFLVITSCSKDDEVSYRVIKPTSIKFVHEDGSAIITCINPNESYAVTIETKVIGAGEYQPTKIDYTVNGMSHSMTFLTEGSQRNLVQLTSGVNVSQVVKTGLKSEVFYFTQDDFQLVE